MADFTSTEPVRGAAAIQTLLAALIALAVGFGWVDWSTEQIGLIIGGYAALVLVIGEFTRSKVSPV